MNHSRWRLPLQPISEQLTAAGVSPLMARLLSNRGITNPAQMDAFLAADKRLLNDPFLLPDMDKAVIRIQRALLSGEKIAVYGDFDADGITATAILVEGLSQLGASAIPYIPHRVEEGYGLNDSALRKLHKEGVSLVITVDCGISNIAEVESASRMGLDVVVTDHHTVPPQLPQAVAVVNPKRVDSRYPFPKLAGVGVAYKLLLALFDSLGKDTDMETYLDLVTLGTVADMEPLLGENRYLVKRGLDVLRNTNRVGLREIARSAGIQLSAVDPETISWMLGPRLNAAGRVEHAIIGYDILLTQSPEEAERLAAILERRNAERQRLTESVLLKAREKVIARGTNRPIIIVSDKDFPSGVIGVVAGRIAEEFYRPAIVLEQGDKWSKGSARSIPEFDIVAAFNECSTLLSRYGGHPMAAGFTASTENLVRLEERLTEIAAARLSSLDLQPSIAIDVEVPLVSLDPATFHTMQKLAPFGFANPYPTFVSRRVKVLQHRIVGTNGKHLKLKLRDGNATWDAIGFRLGNLASDVAGELDIVYNLELDQWRGSDMLQLSILDFAPTV